MPVFTSMRDGVLVVSVDGDFTAGELSRAGEQGLQSEGVPTPVTVLLDLSGAAGVAKKRPDELGRTGEFFESRRESISRVAVLVPSDDAYRLMSIDGDFATSAGIPSRPFRDRGTAMEWLSDWV